MDTEALKKIKMKNDGKDLDRFQTLLKTVITAPIKDTKKKETAHKVKPAKAK